MNLRTFGEYAKDISVPYVTSELERSSRVDLVLDVYLKDSLKMTARENRGTEARRRVLLNVKLSSYWKNVLRNDDNKDELFQFLANVSASQDTGDRVILSTIHKSVVSLNSVVKLDGLQPCSYKEADTRILLHVNDAINYEYKDTIIRTVDTDVVVLLFWQLPISRTWKTSETSGLLLAQGQISDIYQLARCIGPDMANRQILFHKRTIRPLTLQ